MIGSQKERFVPLRASSGIFTNQQGKEIEYGSVEAVLLDESGYPIRFLKLKTPKNNEKFAEQLSDAYAEKKICVADVHVSYSEGKNGTTIATFEIDNFELED
jgi:hypothetical protein